MPPPAPTLFCEAGAIPVEVSALPHEEVGLDVDLTQLAAAGRPAEQSLVHVGRGDGAALRVGLARPEVVGGGASSALGRPEAALDSFKTVQAAGA